MPETKLLVGPSAGLVPMFFTVGTGGLGDPARPKPEAVDRWYEAKIPHRIITPAELEADVVEIQEYVDELVVDQVEAVEDLEAIEQLEREADLAVALADLELENLRQRALLVELEQNLARARAALEAAQRFRMRVAAAIAVLEYFT